MWGLVLRRRTDMQDAGYFCCCGKVRRAYLQADLDHEAHKAGIGVSSN